MIFCDTKAPLKYLRDGNTSAGVGRRDASCRITPFRRDRVSEVCQCGDILLAFPLFIPASQKCRSHEIAEHYEQGIAKSDRSTSTRADPSCRGCRCLHIPGGKALYLLMFFRNYTGSWNAVARLRDDLLRAGARP
jgi:hypothetical protein